jgi:hypothetical protein
LRETLGVGWDRALNASQLGRLLLRSVLGCMLALYLKVVRQGLVERAKRGILSVAACGGLLRKTWQQERRAAPTLRRIAEPYLRGLLAQGELN